MVLQPVSQTKSRFVQLATSGLLLIQATIATTTLSAFVSTNSGWMSASAQETQPTIPVSGVNRSSAAVLGPTPIVADCSAVLEVPIRLPHCFSTPTGGSEGGNLTDPDPGVRLDVAREINDGVHLEIRPRESDSIEMRIVFPL